VAAKDGSRHCTVEVDAMRRSDADIDTTRRKTERTMDFIERLFGVAPDGGSGWLEAAYLIVATGLVAFCVAWRRRLASVRIERASERRRPGR